jgi:hypothetical protein
VNVQQFCVLRLEFCGHFGRFLSLVFTTFLLAELGLFGQFLGAHWHRSSEIGGVALQKGSYYFS